MEYTEAELVAEATITPEEIGNQLSFGLSTALDDLDDFITAPVLAASTEAFLAWFTDTTSTEILGHEYELNSTADQLCTNVESTTKELRIRLHDRIGYAKDRQAEAVDEYFALRTNWEASIHTNQVETQQTFNNAITAVANQSGILLNNDKYTTFATDVTAAYDAYTKAITLNNQRLLSALRVERDNKTARLNTLTNDYESQVSSAIDTVIDQCANNTGNEYLTLQNAWEIARTDVSSSYDSTVITEEFITYDTNLKAAKQTLITSYEALKAAL